LCLASSKSRTGELQTQTATTVESSTARISTISGPPSYIESTAACTGASASFSTSSEDVDVWYCRGNKRVVEKKKGQPDAGAEVAPNNDYETIENALNSGDPDGPQAEVGNSSCSPSRLQGHQSDEVPSGGNV